MAGPLGAGGFEPRTSPAERKDFFDVRRLVRGRINWGGVWSVNKAPYDQNDLVTDEGWTMICVEPTGCTERPAPQPFGDPFWAYQGTEPTNAGSFKTVTFGNRYTFEQPGYLTGYRIWTVAGNLYRVFSVVDPEGANEISELPLIASATGGWLEFGLADTLVSVGTTFELACIVSEPGGTATPIPGDWLYDTPQNTRIPGPGEIIHANSSTSVLSVSTEDINGPVDLTPLSVGDTIDVSGTSWAIQSITFGGTYWDFGIAPAVQIAPDGVYEFIFNTVQPTPISYLRDFDYWPTTPYTVQGLFGVDGGTVALNDSAYGTDIKVQPASISDQWEPVASSSSGSSAGGSTAIDWTVDFDSTYIGGTPVSLPLVGSNIQIGSIARSWTNPYDVDFLVAFGLQGLLYVYDGTICYGRWDLASGSDGSRVLGREWRKGNQGTGGTQFNHSIDNFESYFLVPAGETVNVDLVGRTSGATAGYLDYFEHYRKVLGPA